MFTCGLRPLQRPTLWLRTSTFFITTRAYGKKKLTPVIDSHGNYKLVDIRQAGKKKYRRISPSQYMVMPDSKPGRGIIRGNGKLRGLRTDTKEVQVSKTISWLLRHGAKSEGLDMRPDGYVRVTDLVRHKKLNSLLDFPMLQEIVKEDQKQRYTLLYEPDTLPGSTETVWWIRANQGHSIKSVKLELQPITSANDIRMAVHGTTRKAWESIKTQGLSKMTRNHIHLAQGVAGDNVVSGMRKSCQILIYIDVQKALDASIPFELSSNGVVLTAGDNHGFLSPNFFKRVEDSKRVPLQGWEDAPDVTKEAEESGIPEKTTLTVEIPEDKVQRDDDVVVEKLENLELK